LFLVTASFGTFPLAPDAAIIPCRKVSLAAVRTHNDIVRVNAIAGNDIFNKFNAERFGCKALRTECDDSEDRENREYSYKKVHIFPLSRGSWSFKRMFGHLFQFFTSALGKAIMAFRNLMEAE
jgi:hypothetical protein